MAKRNHIVKDTNYQSFDAMTYKAAWNAKETWTRMCDAAAGSNQSQVDIEAHQHSKRWKGKEERRNLYKITSQHSSFQSKEGFSKTNENYSKGLCSGNTYEINLCGLNSSHIKLEIKGKLSSVHNYLATKNLRKLTDYSDFVSSISSRVLYFVHFITFHIK